MSSSRIRLPHKSITNMVQSIQPHSIRTISYDYNGKMLASVSRDRNQSIKLFKLIDKKWMEIQEIKYSPSSNGHRHKAAIIDICWSHPLFGSLFATLSIDKMINIFQLKLSQHEHDDHQSFEFVQIAHFTESSNIVCCEFMPHHLGLKLAIVCNDGIVKIMDARDITNVSQWRLSEQIVIDQNRLKPFHRLPFKPKRTENRNIIHKSNNKENIEIYCISWNHSKLEFPSFCVGANRNRIFIYGYTGKIWNCIQNINIPSDCEFQVHSVCWCKNIARKYHLIAMGGSDGFVRVVEIRTNDKKDVNKPFLWNVVYEYKIHSASVYKIKWNISGTALLSVDRHGNVYLLTKDRLKHGLQNSYNAKCLSSADEHVVKKEEMEVKEEMNNNHVFGSAFNNNSNNNDNNNNFGAQFDTFSSNVNKDNNFGSAFTGFAANNKDNDNDNDGNHNFGSGFAAFDSNNNDNDKNSGAFGSNDNGNNNFGANFANNGDNNNNAGPSSGSKDISANKNNAPFSFGSFGNTNNNGFSFGEGNTNNNAFGNTNNNAWSWGDHK